VWHCVTPDAFQAVVKGYQDSRVTLIETKLQAKSNTKYSHPLTSEVEALGQLAESEYLLCMQIFQDKTDTKLLFKRITKQINIQIAQKLTQFNT
jgi:hypothetical protein